MVEIKAGALPTAPIGLSVADPDERKKYNESVQKVLEAFENRSQIPWFKMAAAFADPGRTGTFGEAFGKAMGTIGQAQEEDRARALPIAQMRAQLAGQQYEMSKEEKALNAFAAALGTTPQNLQAGMAGAANNPAMMQRLNAAMPMFYGSPKIMEMAKTLFGQHKDIAQFLLEERKAGMTEADLVAKYGDEIIPMIRGYGNVQGTGAPRPQAGAPQAGAPQTGGQTTTQPEPELTPEQLANRPAIEDPNAPVINRNIGVVPPNARETPAPVSRVITATEALGAPTIEPNRIISPTGEVLAERGASSLADWSKLKESTLAEYNRRRAEEIKFERDQITNASSQRAESFGPRVKEVGTINPDEILRVQGLYDSLDNLVNADPDMNKALGLMMKQGAGAAMYELAKNGVRINNFGIGVDAYPAFVKQLPADKQEKLRQMEMILSNIFIQKAKDGKSAFGPSISNADIITQKEPMASIRDTGKIINSWITQERTIADQKLEIAAAYADFVAGAEGTNKKPYQFFNSKEYKDISKKYSQIYRDLALVTYGAPR
jgi:hypothetical protein